MPYKDGAFGQTQRQGASCKPLVKAKASVANGYANSKPVGASLLANAVGHQTEWLTVTPPSRAGSLPHEGGDGQRSLCSIAYFTSSASEVMLSFCISRALWVLMVLLLKASCWAISLTFAP